MHVSLSRNRAITLYFSSLQDDHLSIKRYGMKRSTSCKLVVLLHHTTAHLASIFFEQLFQPLPQKPVNMRISESSCSRFDVTSGPRPIPRAIENQRFHQIEKICGKLLNKISFIVLAILVFTVISSLIFMLVLIAIIILVILALIVSFFWPRLFEG